MDYYIRNATNKDQASLLLMMEAHALFEGHILEISKQHQLLSNLQALPITIFVVCSNGSLVVYMSVIKQFSTWDMDWYLYLDCLYLSEEMRGQGIGLKLMEKLKTYAIDNRIKNIQWQTPIDNFHAIEFYQKLGAVKKTKQSFFWDI
jgi:ribosomal protein S18 acetylase RimI-like enzyme